MERKQFTFYKSFKETLMRMSKSQRLELYDAITDYGIYGQILTPISPKTEGIFQLIQPVLDSSARKAASACKAAAKRKQNGSKKENENESEIELENELETETETDCSQGVCSDNFFDIFWELYPVKIDRPEAVRAWQRLQPDQSCREQILDSLSHWKKCSRWQNEAGRYIPNAAAFLDKGYWQEIPSQGKPDIPKGASGLGEAEKENIRRVLGQ